MPLDGAMFSSPVSPSGSMNYASEELQTARRLLLIVSSSKSKESKDLPERLRTRAPGILTGLF